MAADRSEPATADASVDLESLLVQARDELGKLRELEREIEQRIDGEQPEPPAASQPDTMKGNGVLEEVRLRGVDDFGEALEVSQRLGGAFALRSYEQGIVRLAVIPARPLRDDDVSALSAAAQGRRLRQESHDTFALD